MNIDFVVEFVRLIPRPIKTKTHMQLVNIVENGSRIELEHMWTDVELDELFLKKAAPNPHMVLVYSFVRDNQELFSK